MLQRGRERVIGAWDLGGAIVDPGPESRIETLLAGLTEQPRALLLTHIHLDHAGAAGALVERFPDLEVWVHARGAPHLIDPTPLLASASASTATRWAALWGRVVPVPEQQHARPRGRRDDRASPAASSTSSTRRGTPLTTSSTSTAPTAPPTSATSPACGSRRPTSCGRRRRRRTSTCEAWQRSIDLVGGARPAAAGADPLRLVDDPAPASRADEARPRRLQAELVRGCSTSTATRREARARVRRGGATRSTARGGR